MKYAIEFYDYAVLLHGCGDLSLWLSRQCSLNAWQRLEVIIPQTAVQVRDVPPFQILVCSAQAG
jgi:hypothetical protein